MTQKTLNYLATQAGIREAINMLLDELQKCSAQPVPDKIVWPQLHFDEELTFDTFKKFESNSIDFKGTGTRVWNILEERHRMFYNDETPYYVGDMLKKGVVATITGKKTMAFVAMFLSEHGLLPDTTRDDWVAPDLRSTPDQVRPPEWRAHDVLVTEDILSAFRQQYPHPVLNNYYFKLLNDIMWKLSAPQNDIPYNRRLWVGTFGHPAFKALILDTLFQLKDDPRGPNHLRGVDAWPYYESFIRFLGIEPESTPVGWMPIDMKAE